MTSRIQSRREFFAATAAAVLAARPLAARTVARLSAAESIADLERVSGGRLGVSLIDAGGGVLLTHRGDERFPMCSTFKAVLVAAVLDRSVRESDLLSSRLAITTADLVSYSPVTEQHVGTGLTVAELCEATLRVSDNAAANLLMRVLGGPRAVTAYARTIGNEVFRLDRWETELNTAVPGDLRDTVSPTAMAQSLRVLTLGHALPHAQRDQFIVWLKANSTGLKRIRAAVPSAWPIADRTGTGAYGTTNAVAVIWPPSGQGRVLSVYYTQTTPEAGRREDVVADAARAAMVLVR